MDPLTHYMSTIALYQDLGFSTIELYYYFSNNVINYLENLLVKIKQNYDFDYFEILKT